MSQEHVVDTIGILCQSGSGGDHIAITNISLNNILRTNTVWTPKCSTCGRFGKSNKIEIFERQLICSWAVRPVKHFIFTLNKTTVLIILSWSNNFQKICWSRLNSINGCWTWVSTHSRVKFALRFRSLIESVLVLNRVWWVHVTLLWKG